MALYRVSQKLNKNFIFVYNTTRQHLQDTIYGTEDSFRDTPYERKKTNPSSLYPEQSDVQKK